MADNMECGGERLLTESGLKYMLKKMTGKILLAVGVVRAEGDAPLSLWREETDDGITIRGSVDLSSCATADGLSEEVSARQEADNKLQTMAESAASTAEVAKEEAEAALTTAEGKQDKLTAGDNITISEDNVISATGGSGDADLSEYQKKLKAYAETEASSSAYNGVTAKLGETGITFGDLTLNGVTHESAAIFDAIQTIGTLGTLNRLNTLNTLNTLGTLGVLNTLGTVTNLGTVTSLGNISVIGTGDYSTNKTEVFNPWYYYGKGSGDNEIATKGDIPDVSGYLTEVAAAETYQGKLECYTESNAGVSIETKDVGYGTAKLELNTGNNERMKFVTPVGTTSFTGLSMIIEGSSGPATITLDGAKVLTEGEEWDEVLALRDFYDGINISTSSKIGQVPVDKNLCFISISSDETLGLKEELPQGRTVVVFIRNRQSSPYTISGINEGNFACMNGLDELVVPAGGKACIVISSLEYTSTMYYAVTAYNSEPVAKQSDIPDLSGYATIQNVYSKLETLGVLTAPTIAVKDGDCDANITDGSFRIGFDPDFQLNDYATTGYLGVYSQSNVGARIYLKNGTLRADYLGDEGEVTLDAYQNEHPTFPHSVTVSSTYTEIFEELEHADGVWVALLGYYRLFNPTTQYDTIVESKNYLHVYMSNDCLFTKVVDEIGQTN